ncbi:MAG: hypothetical protein WCI67_18825 [Chloroflexales bacterium]
MKPRNPHAAALVALVLLTLLPLAAMAQPAPPDGFADPAFRQIWSVADAPVAAGSAGRSWTWGELPGERRYERYDQAPGAARLVQYFDKARMEVSDPAGDRRSPWFVTCGLLVVELIAGRTQVGAAAFAPRAPADIPVVGDLAGNPDAPTYAMLAPLAAIDGGQRGEHRVGRRVGVAGQVADDRDVGGGARREGRRADLGAPGDQLDDQQAAGDEPGRAAVASRVANLHARLIEVLHQAGRAGGLVVALVAALAGQLAPRPRPTGAAGGDRRVCDGPDLAEGRVGESIWRRGLGHGGERQQREQDERDERGGVGVAWLHGPYYSIRQGYREQGTEMAKGGVSRQGTIYAPLLRAGEGLGVRAARRQISYLKGIAARTRRPARRRSRPQARCGSAP